MCWCVCEKEEREMKGSGRNKKGDRVDILSTFRVWVGRREEKEERKKKVWLAGMGNAEGGGKSGTNNRLKKSPGLGREPLEEIVASDF